jgi:hypothetical protein
MAGTQFWNEARMEPKRNFRFQLILGDGKNTFATWIVKKVSRPSYKVDEATHKYLMHSFHFPGQVEWEPVECTLVDPISHNAALQTRKIIENSGYNWLSPKPKPPIDGNNKATISKKNAINALGSVKIQQIDADGKLVEVWTLWNAWLKDVTFSELDYENTDLSDITLSFRYDYAVLAAGADK